MKTLKFVPHLAEMIVAEEKTCTWRIFDDKEIERGDDIEFYNKETEELFGHAKIKEVYIKTLETITDEDLQGHERFANFDEMVETYKNYYGDKVTLSTPIKIIRFEFTPVIHK